MRALVIAGGVAAALAGGGGLGWHAWTESPTYSLKRVAGAVEQRDRYTFEKHVDLDALIGSMTTDLSEGNALAAAVGGAVVGPLKVQVIKAVEDGKVPPDSRIGVAIQKTTAGQLPPIERQGRNAYFTLDVTTNGGAPFGLKVHMTQVPDGYWRIDRLVNMRELRAAEELEEKARRAAIARANEESLAKLEVTAKVHTSIREGWSRKNRFQIRFTNKHDKPISEMTGKIALPAQSFEHGIRGAIQVAPGASENGVWDFDVNRFIADTERVYALGETEDFIVDVDSITFADGTKVERGDDS